MTLNPQDFALYDIQQFPLVTMRNQAVVPGYAPQWEQELNRLIAQPLPFVIIFPPDRPDTENSEDRKRRMRWFKAHREAFGKACRALISVQPDPAEREQQRAHANEILHFFGTPLASVASLAEAIALGEKLMKDGLL